MSVHGMSRELADLVKAVGDCKSKQEEDKIITKVSSPSCSRTCVPSQLPVEKDPSIYLPLDFHPEHGKKSILDVKPQMLKSAPKTMQEVALLRVRLGEKDASSRMKELCIRMIYCEMLGHPVEFGYIHAVNMTQHNGLGEKKLGYLTASLFLDDSSELLILLVNTLQVLTRSPSSSSDLKLTCC